MKYRNLGHSGLRVSEISLGSYLNFAGHISDEDSIKCIQKAYEEGVNLFDTADVYQNGESEKLIAKALSLYPRNSYSLCTKVFMPKNKSVTAKGLSRKNIMDTVYSSLKNFNTDFIDVLLCHRFDNEVPLYETISTFNDLIRRGLILYWGVSRWTNEQMLEANEICNKYNFEKPICNQYFYNLLNREAEEIFDTCKKLGIGIMAYSPLAQGVLTGKYINGIPNDSRANDQILKESMWHLKDVHEVNRLNEISSENDISLLHMSLLWILNKEIVSTMIIGVSKVEQMVYNLEIFDIDINSELMSRL